MQNKIAPFFNVVLMNTIFPQCEEKQILFSDTAEMSLTTAEYLFSDAPA